MTNAACHCCEEEVRYVAAQEHGGFGGLSTKEGAWPVSNDILNSVTAGLLTEDEYASKKAELLKQL
ncbi:MAG: hypothetical protein K1X64_21665 [Myxococcaceae bacterium]|nr:hypothetical protein [Myxococcaceae bacterium]